MPIDASLGTHGGASISAHDFFWRHASRINPTLESVTFDIQPGERVLLLGESGAGKSTLLQAIAGVLGGDDEGDSQGTLLVDGHHPQAPAARGIVGYLLQDPDGQVISSRVGDDVAFGCENLGVPREETWRRVAEALDLAGLDLPLDHPTSELSGGQKQRLALAGVIAMGARIILLDEPTANLDPEGVIEVRDAVARVAEQTGATVVVVEHKVDVWQEFCQRVIVLGARERGIVADGPTSSVLREYGPALSEQGVWVPGIPLDLPVSRSMARSVSRPVARSVSVGSNSHNAGIDTIDLVTGWNHAMSAPISENLPLGASTVITGKNGSGKSTFALTVAGLLDKWGGRVVAHDAVAQGLGEDPGEWSSAQLATRIGYVFQDPEHQFVARTVREELLIGPAVMGKGKRKPSFFKRVFGGGLSEFVTAEDKKRADELLERLKLDALAEANPFSLSGGQKRRLSVATALVSAPQMLILDEPTFGQDRKTFRDLVILLRELADDGHGIVSITHDDTFINALGDHRIHFESGSGR